jgi:flagellar biogenesis protein FliO
MSRKIEEQNLEQIVTRKSTTRTAKPKGTTESTTTKARSTRKRGIAKTRAAGKKNELVESAITAPEIVSCEETQPQAHELLQEAFIPAGLEAQPDLDSKMSQEMSCQAEANAPGNALDEKQFDDREQVAQFKTESVETQDSTELRQSAISNGLAAAWNWARTKLASRQSRKRLRVCETVSLGEKRFVAVIEVDGEQFLVGGASSSVATLARLDPTPGFSQVLRRRWAQDPVQA